MENIVLTIGGLLKSFTWSDLFFFGITLILILILIYIVYLIRLDTVDLLGLEDKTKEDAKEQIPKADKPLTAIVDDIELNYKPKPIDLSEYEKEQENTAIISYDELLKSVSNNIYYEDEYDSGFDDVLIQKVDNKESKTQELVDLPKAIMMSYEAEEDFLKALKVLQSNLVR